MDNEIDKKPELTPCAYCGVKTAWGKVCYSCQKREDTLRRAEEPYWGNR